MWVRQCSFFCCFCLKSAVVCTCCDTYSRSQAPYKLAIFSVLLFVCLCCCCSKRAAEELSALGSSRMGTVAGATVHLTASYSCQVQGHGVLHLLTSPNGSLSHLAKMNPRLVCIRSRPQVLPQRSRMIICKSMESETTDGSEEVAKVESSSNGSSLAPPPPSSSSSPFTSGKISSRIAVKSVSNGETGRPSPNNSASLTDESKPPGPSSISTMPQKPAIRTTTEFKPSKSLLEKGNQGAFPTGRISPFAEDRLKSSVPPSSTNRASSRTMINSGKQVLEAFKRGEVEGKTTKFGQPIVPKNIFEDTRRTPEEIAAEKFQFQLSTDALLLGLSFVLVIALMLATAYLVWKVGAIHYNE